MDRLDSLLFLNRLDACLHGFLCLLYSFFFSFLMASFASNGKNEGEQKKKRERNVYRFRFRVRENHCSLSFLLTFDIWVKPMHTSEKKKERKRKRENSDMRISYLSSSCT